MLQAHECVKPADSWQLIKCRCWCREDEYVSLRTFIRGLANLAMKPIARWYQCPDCQAWLLLLQWLQSLLFQPMQAWWTRSFSASAPLPWERNTRKLGNNCSWAIWMPPATASWRRWKTNKALSKPKPFAPHKASACTLLAKVYLNSSTGEVSLEGLTISNRSLSDWWFCYWSLASILDCAY